MQLIKMAVVVALGVADAMAQTAPPAAPKVTHVLATLTVKTGVTREQLLPVMQAEVRETVELYLDGKIEQWYGRGDGKGVVFVLNCGSVAEAKAILEGLPLVKGDFASFEYMPLGPLNPLRVLLGPPAKAAATAPSK